MRGNGKLVLLLLLFVAMILTACSDKKEVVVSADTPEQPEENQPEEEEVGEPQLPFAAPFTGIRSEVEIKARPVLATINNHPKARPQSGIADADIVYELMAEGSVTRLLALFQSELPEEIGPVRSARDYFIEIADGLDAFFIAHGYSPEAKRMLESGMVDHINGMAYDGILFWRSKDRVAPHNSYISGENILKGMEKVHANSVLEKDPALSFYDSAEDVKMETLANTIEVRFGSSKDFHNTYTYDHSSASYSRHSGGVLTVDHSTGDEIKLSNVLFFETDHRTIDKEGRQEIDLTSGGKAYLFQAGTMRQIEWSNIDGIIMPVENGQAVKLVPGKTWIHVVPTKPGLASSVTFTQ